MKELLTALEQQRQESDTSLFETRKQMRRNMEYYAVQRIGNEREGRSHYVSPDVHDVVESYKGLFRETFLSNRDVVKFVSDGTTSTEEALAKTKYANSVVSGAGRAEMFSDLWHDALVQKRGSLLVEWVSDEQEVTIPLEGAPPEMVSQQLAQMQHVVSIDESEVRAEVQQTIDPMTGMINQSQTLFGQITVTIDPGKWQLTVMKPENYLRDPKAATLKDAMWAIHMDEVPRGTLIRLGYERSQIDDLTIDRAYRQSEVDQSRKSFDQTSHTQQMQSRIDDQENVTVYKTWTWLNLNGMGYDEYDDDVRLYEIHWVKDEILRWKGSTDDDGSAVEGSLAIREVDEIPIFEWSDIRIPHAESSMCVSDLAAHQQRARTMLQRAVIDNQNIRNNTRFEAVADMLHNPRDLLDNSIGGVIFTDQIGSVVPLATPELSPLTFQVLQMMDQDGEKRSGMSSLAKGMNTDALRYQNGADMVERLTNAAKTRPMGAARDFAETFLVPLCKYICRYAMGVDSSQQVMESGGRQIVIAPSQWQSDSTDMQVVAALTPQESQDQAQKLMVMHQAIQMDPVLSQLYGIKERHALMDDVFENIGVQDTTRYLMRPESPEFQQMQMQKQQMEQQMQQMQQQMLAMQVQMQQQQMDLAWATENNRQIDRMEDNAREDFKAEVDARQGDRDLDIKEMKAS